ncbi:hypothetical protein BDK92_4702 [Micromonospora pisi]|uniref:Uncharacterized protein n=1 Tax=Micromonospora pisi TaxID=589240 RepID=A0A495JPP4_9ACTN|nr:hypothetical protein [Micromonospora pisi]RKR90332.1 hypothetical protein BDK92_4702 [Micromonospora pisi]
MLVRRGAARLATVCALLAGLVVAGAAPALADDEDSVRISTSSSFTAGGSPGSVTVTVAKRSKGCVSVRTSVALQMAGLSASDVGLLVARDGDWQPVSVSGEGTLHSGRTAPEKAELCERKSVSVRYRLALGANVPAGQVTIVGEAYTAGGDLIKQDAETRRVNGAKGAPTPTRTRSASPSPTPEETTEAAEPEPTESDVVAPPTEIGLGGGAGGDGGGIGSMVMVVGVGMVAIGIALLVLLLRRARGGREEPDGGSGGLGATPRPPYPPRGGPGGDPTMIIPGRADPTMIIPGRADPTMVIPGRADPTVVMPTGGDSTVIMPRIRP